MVSNRDELALRLYNQTKILGVQRALILVQRKAFHYDRQYFVIIIMLNFSRLIFNR
ncbi:hypothetical protein AEST_05700 [Alishewanella aestuarii B11]|uniref:Uncharacterized protein n=1 Tax=Alishewanella aestuarii B11 TaxID=1197174 RepID=J1Q621_9ALTE|nr:hypothetical protein AEST_05700 [Alishewanella aestuarii B11]